MKNYRMGRSLFLTYKPASISIVLLAASGVRISAQSPLVFGLKTSAGSSRLAVAFVDPILSNSWFLAFCLIFALGMAVAILWLRFVGAERRERELRQLVAQKTADLRKANEELFYLSFTDTLTGIANRRLFDKVLERECARVHRMNSFTSLLSIDVDYFKALNDSEGHQKGDECLVALGGLLSKVCRRKLDLAARYGGEEFAMILPLTDSIAAERVAESVRQAVADLKIPHPASPIAPHATISIGVATATKDCCSAPGLLIAAADRALYEAKRTGRNRVRVAPHSGASDN